MTDLMSSKDEGWRYYQLIDWCGASRRSWPPSPGPKSKVGGVSRCSRSGPAIAGPSPRRPRGSSLVREREQPASRAAAAVAASGAGT
jgi:hypothetical protein